MAPGAKLRTVFILFQLQGALGEAEDGTCGVLCTHAVLVLVVDKLDGDDPVELALPCTAVA